MDDRLEQPELDDLWDFDDPVGSAARFERAAGEHQSEIVRAELETQRARALGLQRRFAEADALLDLLEPALGRLAVRILLERGRLRNTAGSTEDAIALFEEALVAARREGETFLAVDAAHMLAIADRPHAEQWTDEAFAELRNTSDERTLRWGVTLHTNLGLEALRGVRPGGRTARVRGGTRGRRRPRHRGSALRGRVDDRPLPARTRSRRARRSSSSAGWPTSGRTTSSWRGNWRH